MSRRSSLGRLCGVATLLTAWLTPQAGSAQATTEGYTPPLIFDGQTHIERTDTVFGRFTVTRNVEDNRAVPILHSAYLAKEALLSWRDSTGTIAFSLTDTGGSVRFSPHAGSADGTTLCITQPILIGYSSAPATIETWRRLQAFIGQQLRTCPAVLPVDLRRALAEMAASGTDYVPAANAWKAVSAELFGAHAKRCVVERPVDRRRMTIPPRFECVRYSRE